MSGNASKAKPRKRSVEQVIARRKTQAINRRAQTAEGQDIGEIPPVKDAGRRSACLEDLALFCKTYLPGVFYLPWSKDHLRVITGIEHVAIYHDSQAIAMPRGSGKSSLCEAAILRAVLKGDDRFSVLLAAIAKKASDSIRWFKRALTHNQLLFEDFPEVCHPLRLLQNEARRCLGQSYKGERTNILWAHDRIILPTIPDRPTSGSILHSCGIGGNVRGLKLDMPDGTVIRPTLAMVDDPQTAKSARSQGPAGQTARRLQVILQDVQGLAGPDAQVGVMVPCTVIESGDLADQILDRKLYPDFRGERTKRFYSWPTHMKLWEQYRELRESAMQAGEPLDESVEFYRSRMCNQGRKLDEPAECPDCPHRANCMDCGAVVDWADRRGMRNLSAVQDAMHSLYKYGPVGFAAEFQNEPLLGDGTGQRLNAALCRSRVSGHTRFDIPVGCTELTMGVDVQQHSLWYVIVAWQPNFTGHVVDYGVWPPQSRAVYTKAEIAVSMNNIQTRYPNRGIEGTIQAALEEFIPRAQAQNFQRSGGGNLMRLGRDLVDSGKWDNVIAAVKMKVGGATMLLSKGFGIGASKVPMARRSRKPGERWDKLGFWYIPVTQGTKEFPAVHVDTNHWKSFVHQGFLTAPGDPGAITIFGNDPMAHEMYASHICAETYGPEPFFGHGRWVEEWKIRPERPDNDWLDAMVLATVGASMLGCRRGEGSQQQTRTVIKRLPRPWDSKAS